MSEYHDGASVSPEVFQELISERGAKRKQKAEQKRLNDLKRIQEMKSRDGKDPISILPKEMWQIILDKLSPEDRSNMCQVHHMFRQAMENSHVSNNLLPQILKFEVDKFWGNENTLPVLKKEANCKIPLAHFLELRGLSRTLRDRIDQYIEEHLLNILRRGECISKIPKIATKFYLNSNFPDMTLLDKVITFYRENPNSRFVSRSLQVSLKLLRGTSNSYLNLYEQFRKKMLSLLESVGEQILHFSLFVINYSQIQGRVGAVKLRLPFNEWLKLMPNLKWFQVRVFCAQPLEYCVDLVDLRRQLIPKLVKLERTDFVIVPYIAQHNKNHFQSIPRVILEANPHINILRIAGKGHFVFPVVELPLLHFFDPGLHKDTFETVTNVLNINWPLKRLFLCLDLESNITLDSVFQLLNHFSALEQLNVKTTNAKIAGRIEFLMLSQLKVMDIEIVTPIINYDDRAAFYFFFSLQFMLYCKNLTMLKWTIESQEVKMLSGVLKKANLPLNIINFRGGWADLCKSNIWQTFPILRCVRATFKNLNDPIEAIENVELYRP